MKQLTRSFYSGWLVTLGVCLCLVLGLSPAASVRAQAPAVSSQQVEQRKTSKPYSGDLSTFEYKDRAKKLQVEKVMDILGISSGKTVADIGAGSGWFSVRAARRVTPTGLVYAVDISQKAISYIQERTRRDGIRNLHTVLSKPDDPLLPMESIDAALLLKTYHEVASPVALLKNLHKALRPKARVGIIDRNGNGENHGVNRDVVVREAAQAGYRLIGEYDFVKSDGQDYFLVFETD
ncbi:MAG: class I SAM-dependent methyltransferase [Acidobacteriales bacterium]|nr:class I SAM-dependent methyltransferase [Terriglobales bacterium]